MFDYKIFKYENMFYKNLTKTNTIHKQLLKGMNLETDIGDGIVPMISLRIPVLWTKNGLYPNLDKLSKIYKPVEITVLRGKQMTHQNIINETKFLKTILPIIM